MTAIHGRMMFESVLTNHVHQGRERRHADHRARSKSIQWIVREFPLANIGADSAAQIICTDSAEGERPPVSAAFHGAERVLLSQRRSENRRGRNPNIRHKLLCPV